MALSQEARRIRVFAQQFRDEQARNSIAEWLGVQTSAVAKWSFANHSNVKATLQLMSYPDFARVTAGKVHTLLKALVHSAINGSHESIVDFKAAVDLELGEEGLARLAHWKRVNYLGDCCVENLYSIRSTRKDAEREGLALESETLLKIEQDLALLTKKLRREARVLSRIGRL